MAGIGSLLIKVGLVTKDLTKSLKDAERKLQRSGQRMQNIGARLSATLTAAIGGVGVSAVSTAAEFEMLQNSLNILTGSVEEGAKAFERLKDFSSKTPFQLQDLMKANNTLMGFGLTADESFESFKKLGDVAAVAGGDLQRIAVAYGQSIAANRVDARDILQFINNGVPIMEMLAEAMGVAVSEVKELASEGKVTGDVLQKAFSLATAEGSRFYGGLEKASQTLSGKFSTLKDNISLALGTIGESIAESINLKEVIDSLIKTVKNIADGFKKLPDSVKKAIVIFSGLLAALGPVLLTLGSAKLALAGVAGALSSIITVGALATTGVIAVAGALAVLAYRNNTAHRTTKRLNEEFDKAVSKHMAPYISRLSDLSMKLETARIEGKDFSSIQKDLVSEFGDHIENVDDLGGSYEELKAAIDEAGTSIQEYSNKVAAGEMMKAIQSEINDLVKTRNNAAVDLQKTIGISAVDFTKAMQGLTGTLAERENELLKRLFSNGQGGINYAEANKLSNKQRAIIKDIIAKEMSLNEELKIRTELYKELGGSIEELTKKQEESVNKTKKQTSGKNPQIEALKELTDAFKVSLKELENLKEAGLISDKDFADEKLKIYTDLVKELAKAGFAESLIYRESAEEMVRLRNEANKPVQSIDPKFQGTGADTKKFLKDTADKALEGGVETKDIISDEQFEKLKLYKDAMMSIGNSLSQMFDRINDSKASVIKNQYEAQINAVKKLGLSEEQRIKRITKLEEERDKKMAAIQKRQAKREKAFAVLTAAIQTALAVIMALKSGRPTALLEAKLVGAAGAVQVGAIMAAPIPQFANGGIVSGRTLAEVGEYSGARSNPEVIAPLDKLRGMISDLGGGQMTGDFRLRGEDLILAVDRANKNSGRYSGNNQF